MNTQRAKYARVAGWINVGLAILMLALYVVMSLTGGDVSPAIAIIGMVNMFIGVSALARAKRASQSVGE